MKQKRNKKFIAVSIIPTGIKCEIGGFIGDATQVTNALAKQCDFLITNPNAVNAGAFNFMRENILYVEGFALDQLFLGKLGLRLSKNNKIGVVIEKINDKTGLKLVLKTIEAFSVINGIKITNIELIKPLKKKIIFFKNQFLGEVKNVERIFKAVEKSIAKGAQAIALGTYIPCKKHHIFLYQKGKLPNPYGQIEAVLSHAVIDKFCLPCAHAPILKKSEIEYFLFKSFYSDKRTACENISSAYLGSVLIGLKNAPRYEKNIGKSHITIKEIDALIVPANCLRSIPVAGAVSYNIPIIEVKENKNIFTFLSKDIKEKIPKLISVKTYQEASQIIKKLKIAYKKC